MKDALSVITAATEGIVENLRKDYEVEKTRMYEMLGAQCVYPKAKVLIRRIAAHNQKGARLIKADLMAMFDDILEPDDCDVTFAEFVKETNDAQNAKLSNAPKCERLKEDREALDVIHRDMANLERETVVSVRVEMRQAVEAKRRNGHK
jgi:hypothetical protein